VATDWTPLGALTDLPEGKPTVRKLDGVDVMVLRRGTAVSAVANACAHLGGPLDEGTIDGDTVTCPWHGSVFDLTDGSIVRGPATAPQPCFEARVEGGQVQIRRRQSHAIIDLTAPVATGVAAAPTLPSQ
jgi:nitrite reductase/ring-hydroxylating ferredoxin subunit